MIRRVASLALAGLALLAAVPAHADDGAPSDDLVGLVDTATVRLLTADDVAANKWITGGSITDPARVQQVLAAVAAAAELAGVPTEFVSKVFADQIDATEAVQYSRFSWWKFDPDAAPLDAPDLSASRALIDELNRRMVTEIAQDWTLLRSPDCAAALETAKAGVAGRRGLDPLYRQALDVATRSYCVG